MSLRRIGSIALSVVMLALALHLLDWPSLKKVLLNLSPWRFTLAVCVSFCQFTMMSIRWYHLIKRRIALAPVEHMKHYFYSVFLNSFTPANLGGDVYRFMILDRHHMSRSSIMAVLVQERLLGLMAFFLFYLAGLGGLWLVQPDTLSQGGELFVMAGGVVGAGVIGLSLLPLTVKRLAKWALGRFHHRVVTTLNDLGGAACFDSVASFVTLIGFSFLAVSIWVLTVQLVAVALDVHIHWLTLGMIVVLVELVRLLPLSVQGIGVRESAYAYLFGMAGQSSEAGFIVGTISYLALSLSILLSGAVGLGCLMATRTDRQT